MTVDKLNTNDKFSGKEGLEGRWIPVYWNVSLLTLLS